jgi:hypothetical protein
MVTAFGGKSCRARVEAKQTGRIMALSDLTSREAVLAAIQEFHDPGRDTFLRAYGFGRARKYFVVYQGASIDSKALVGAAHGQNDSRYIGHRLIRGPRMVVGHDAPDARCSDPSQSTSAGRQVAPAAGAICLAVSLPELPDTLSGAQRDFQDDSESP